MKVLPEWRHDGNALRLDQRRQVPLERVAGAVRAGRVLTPKVWPNGGKVAVCISFDIDNESGMLARELRPLPTALSETEYGATEGLPRILAMLDREKLPASFYIPAVSAMQLVSEDGYVRAFDAGANLATINLTPHTVRADYPICKRDRVIMDEERVLAAIEEAGCEFSSIGVTEYLRNTAEGALVK